MTRLSENLARLVHSLIVLFSVTLFSSAAVAQWEGWENMGGEILDKPECVTWGQGHLHCFARGTDRAMYGKWWTGSGWAGWEYMGGALLNKPECVTWGPGHLHCFARGTDGAMYGKWWTGNGWAGWENMGGVILEQPECVSWGPGHLHCFARGTDGAMYGKWWTGSGWAGWEYMGGVLLNKPKCVTWGPGHLHCFARGTDGAMYGKWWTGNGWAGWENMGGIILEEPECATWGPGHLHCFARGTDRAMYGKWWTGNGWAGWENMGGTLLNKPECATWGPGHLHCFARGTDGAMYGKWWTGSGWAGWENMGGVILEDPECATWGPGHLHCFARGTDRAMYGKWWTGIARHPLTASRHNVSSLTNADVDRILADATSVLRTNDGAGDIACSVTLERSGNVTAFSTGDGSIDTNAELSDVMNLPGNVKVVDDVDFCGVYNTSIIGCGNTPGTSLVVERFSASQEGILWAHEFGHNQGLPHRDTSTNNVMYSSIGSNRRHVNQNECDAYRRQASAIVVAATTLPSTAATQGAASRPSNSGDQMARYEPGGRMPGEQMARYELGGRMPGEQVSQSEPGARMQPQQSLPQMSARAQKTPVEQFVGQIYFEGLPLDEAAGYGNESVDPLIAILKDPSRAQYHENAALTLGMIGSERAVEPLIAHIQNRSDASSRAAHKGRVGAVMALGYIVHRSGSKMAVDFLKSNSSPSAVRLLGVEDGRSDEAKRQDLTKYFLFSLAVSGSPEAADYLKSLSQQVGVGEALPRKAKVDDSIAKSLQLHEQITREGLLNYYKTDRQRAR